MMPLLWPWPCSTATTQGAELSTSLSSSSENSLKRDISRPRARGDREFPRLTRSQDAQRYGALCALLQHGLQIRNALDALAVQREQHVTQEDPRACCRTVFL